MEVLLIRHGDPDYIHDSLTDLGRSEARCLAKDLEQLKIDEIYVSPLGRAQETCRFTADRKGILPDTLDWMMERGIKRGDVYLWEAPGEMFLSTAKPNSEKFSLDKTMPEGCEQFERVKNGFDALMATQGYVRKGDLYRVEKASDKRIALFCHKGVILTLLSDILHWPLPMIFVSLHIHPTGVTKLEMVEKNGLAHFKATAINSLTHLHSCS